MDPDAGLLVRRRRAVQFTPAEANRGQGSRRHGTDQRRISGLHAGRFESIHAPDSRCRRRCRPEPAAAGSRHGVSPTALVRGLCGIQRGVRLLDCSADRWSTGRDVGTLDTAVDHCRMEFPDARHRPRQFLGVLRAGLGRLVVLGSGGKRLVHAMAGRYCIDAFAGRRREARHLQGVDRAVGHHGFFTQPAGDLPRSLRRPELSACLRHGSTAGYFHSRPAQPSHCLVAIALCTACTSRRSGRTL